MLLLKIYKRKPELLNNWCKNISNNMDIQKGYFESLLLYNYNKYYINKMIITLSNEYIYITLMNNKLENIEIFGNILITDVYEHEIDNIDLHNAIIRNMLIIYDCILFYFSVFNINSNYLVPYFNNLINIYMKNNFIINKFEFISYIIYDK